MANTTTELYLNSARVAELWRRCKIAFGQPEIAGAEEVSEMLDEVFGASSGSVAAADAETYLSN